MKKLIYIGVVSFLFSCTKGGGNVYIEGRVYNPITGEGIEGANIIMYRDKPLSGAVGAQSGDTKTVESVYSDADGYYEIKHAGIAKYVVAMYKLGNYYSIGWVDIHTKNKTYTAGGGDTFAAKLSKNMHADFQAVPYGLLHWHISNVNCEGGTDSMWFKTKYIHGDDFIDGWDYIFPYIGCVDINGSGSDKMAMGNHIIYMKIKRPSGTIYKYDTIFVQESNVTYFDLLY